MPAWRCPGPRPSESIREPHQESWRRTRCCLGTPEKDRPMVAGNLAWPERKWSPLPPSLRPRGPLAAHTDGGEGIGREEGEGDRPAVVRVSTRAAPKATRGPCHHLPCARADFRWRARVATRVRGRGRGHCWRRLEFLPEPPPANSHSCA